MSNLKVIFAFDVSAHTGIDFFNPLLFKHIKVRLSTFSSLILALSVFPGATLFLSDYSCNQVSLPMAGGME